MGMGYVWAFNLVRGMVAMGWGREAGCDEVIFGSVRLCAVSSVGNHPEK